MAAEHADTQHQFSIVIEGHPILSGKTRGGQMPVDVSQP